MRIAVAALLVGLAAAPAAAQAPPASAQGRWYTATTYTVKPGMMDEFREFVINEYNPAAKKGGLQQTQVWRYATGGGDRVLRIVLHDSLADRDNGPAVRRGMSPEAYRAYQKKLASLIVSTSSFIGRQRADLTFNPPNSPAPKMAERYVVRVTPGRDADYVKYIQTLIEASKKTGHRRTAGQVVFGANPGVYTSNTYYDSYADLGKGRPPNRVMNADELAAFNKSALGLLTVLSRDVMIYDAEMSMVAPPTSK